MGWKIANTGWVARFFNAVCNEEQTSPEGALKRLSVKWTLGIDPDYLAWDLK